MKKTTSPVDDYEPLPEYDLRKLGVGVVGAIDSSRPMSAGQLQEAARIAVAWETKRALGEMREENDRLRLEIQGIKKRLDIIDRGNPARTRAKNAKATGASPQRKSA